MSNSRATIRTGEEGKFLRIDGVDKKKRWKGMKDSFFGDLHGQGRDAIEFFTENKVVIQRWP